MSATRSQDVTHDVGERISWTLRPAISTKLNMVVFDDLSKMDVPEGQPVPKVGDERKGSDGKTRKVTQVLTWQDRRERMREVCTSCHASGRWTVSTSSSTTSLICIMKICEAGRRDHGGALQGQQADGGSDG